MFILGSVGKKRRDVKSLRNLNFFRKPFDPSLKRYYFGMPCSLTCNTTSLNYHKVLKCPNCVYNFFLQIVNVNYTSNTPVVAVLTLLSSP